MAQTAVTGGSASLARAQGTMIGAARFTAEANAPSYAAIQHEKLASGHKEKVMPKVGKFTFANLTDGEDMTPEQEIGMTNVVLTSGERCIQRNEVSDVYRFSDEHACERLS